MAQKIKSSGRNSFRARKSVPSNEEEFVYYNSVVRGSINRPPGMVRVRVPYGTYANTQKGVFVHLKDIPVYMLGDYSEEAGTITPDEFKAYEKSKDYKDVKKYFIAIEESDALKENTAEYINEQLRIIYNK